MQRLLSTLLCTLVLVLACEIVYWSEMFSAPRFADIAFMLVVALICSLVGWTFALAISRPIVWLRTNFLAAVTSSVLFSLLILAAVVSWLEYVTIIA